MEAWEEVMPSDNGTCHSPLSLNDMLTHTLILIHTHGSTPTHSCSQLHAQVCMHVPLLVSPKQHLWMDFLRLNSISVQ